MDSPEYNGSLKQRAPAAWPQVVKGCENRAKISGPWPYLRRGSTGTVKFMVINKTPARTRSDRAAMIVNPS